MLTYLGILMFWLLPAGLLAMVLRSFYLEYRRDRIPILLYHRLISRSDAERGAVPDNEMIWVSYDTRFAEQMDYLHRSGYTTLSLDDYLAVRSGRFPLPVRPVVITFDDGYLSNYTLAYPALKGHGQKATIFVAPEPDEHTRKLVQGVDGFLSPEQMREMAANGISIQSHTLTHCILSELDDAAATVELTESRRRLADITGQPVEHLAVPRAGYSQRIRQLVKKVGYKTVCCNNKGSANLSSAVLALPRIVVERDMTVEDFARLLSPRSAAILRIVGNVKRIPEWLGGPRFASQVRRKLYGGPLRGLFGTARLKHVILLTALLYLIASVLFTWRLFHAA